MAFPHLLHQTIFAIIAQKPIESLILQCIQHPYHYAIEITMCFNESNTHKYGWECKLSLTSIMSEPNNNNYDQRLTLSQVYQILLLSLSSALITTPTTDFWQILYMFR